jgi:hypothetical protein
VLDDYQVHNLSFLASVCQKNGSGVPDGLQGRACNLHHCYLPLAA